MSVRLTLFKRISLTLASVLTLTLSVGIRPSWAGDPFRSTNPRNIGDNTEAAFEAIFRQGNYKAAKGYLDSAIATEGNDPLVYAMRSSLAYTEEDWGNMRTYASKTLKTAQTLAPQDPLRGNLYIAVGHFLEGAYIFKTDGPLGAIKKLQQVFQYLELAEAQDPNDPELNLLKGYLELILAVNLPFASPDQAIKNFEKYAAPDYMVDRALAMAYRDLKNYDQALRYMDEALTYSPDNPELQYLKGQILRKKAKSVKNYDVSLLKEAYTYFAQAIVKVDQLPEVVLIPLRHDYRAVQDEIKAIDPNAVFQKSSASSTKPTTRTQS